ncbi:hypothetical protein JOF28_002137 [Leucobacter exalbidus]|uniref:Uncharacterized protein n=1 Tax=Leucobacter exalbidus TaxID=662960 RepID=A0A940PPQ6_9MICO|nr:hypothetical protein [Leucobacter exalbidus]MBP1326905.1 hypothetical protein [Leucobacter exalbidus]
MALAHPDARSWAAAHSAATRPRLGMLEAVAFQAHPSAVPTFGEDGAAIAGILRRSRPGSGPRLITGLVMALCALGAVAPIAAVSVIGAESFLIDRVPASVSVPVASWAFVLSAVTLVAVLIAWLRSGAYWSGVLCGLGVVSALFAGFALISMPRVATRDAHELPNLAYVPVWLALLFGCTLAVAVAIRARHHPPEEARPVPGTAQESRSAVAQIPRAALAQVLADRDAALRVLADRSLIDAATLERALRAAPGTLFTLDAGDTATA